MLITKSSTVTCASPVKLCAVLIASAASELIATFATPKLATFTGPPIVGEVSSDTSVKDELITSFPATLYLKVIVSTVLYKSSVTGKSLLEPNSAKPNCVPDELTNGTVFGVSTSGVSLSVVNVICPPTPNTA